MLSFLWQKRNQVLSEEFNDHIQKFYLGDEYFLQLVRIMPGYKHHVSLSQNVHVKEKWLQVEVAIFVTTFSFFAKYSTDELFLISYLQ